MDRVGVIGLGKMGLPIAMNLMSRGFHVTGYRRSGSPGMVAPRLATTFAPGPGAHAAPDPGADRGPRCRSGPA